MSSPFPLNSLSVQEETTSVCVSFSRDNEEVVKDVNEGRRKLYKCTSSNMAKTIYKLKT
jgi:hypothetical protein